MTRAHIMALVSTSASPTLAADRAAWPNAPGALAPPPGARRGGAARLVAIVDIVLLTAALAAAFVDAPAAGWPSTLRDLLTARVRIDAALLLMASAGAAFLILERAGLYDAARLRRWQDETVRVLVATGAIALAAGVVAGWSQDRSTDVAAVARAWMGSFAALAAARAMRARLARPTGYTRVLVVGSGPQAIRICRDLSADPRTRYQVLGFVDTSDRSRSAFIRRRTLGTLDALETLLAREHVDEVHVGLPVRSHYPQIQETIRVCERIGVKVMYAADIFRLALARPRVDGAAQARPRIELRLVADGWTVIAKRVLDVVLAATALLVLAPLMLAIAAVVKQTSPGPVVYAQERYGLNRRRFRMFKFRTMVADAEHLQASLERLNEANGPVFKIRNDPRITAIGRWLRRTSMDELPQLFNVLRGEMSLVGPRPLPLRDVALFTRSGDLRRFSVRPGITGLWQVSGRSGLGFEDWIALDLHYIDGWSLVLDAQILLRTIPAVIRGTGAA
jgi:exopolysaccharide biosynthesis polyprenyl glycosylphosphotransferase